MINKYAFLAFLAFVFVAVMVDSHVREKKTKLGSGIQQERNENARREILKKK